MVISPKASLILS